MGIACGVLTRTNVVLVAPPGWKNTTAAKAATLMNHRAHKRGSDHKFEYVHQRFVVNSAKRAPASGAPNPRMKNAMRVWVSLGVNPVVKGSVGEM